MGISAIEPTVTSGSSVTSTLVSCMEMRPSVSALLPLNLTVGTRLRSTRTFGSGIRRRGPSGDSVNPSEKPTGRTATRVGRHRVTSAP